MLASGISQVGQNTETEKSTEDITLAMLDPNAWEAGVFSGTWKDISTQADKKSRELVSLGKVFGAVPQQVQLYINKDTVQRMEVVFLEAGNFFGFSESKNARYEVNKVKKSASALREEKEAEERAMEPKRKAFSALFAQREKEVALEIERFTKTPGKRVTIGRFKEMRVRAQEFGNDTHLFRLVAQDDQLLSVTIIPAAAGKDKLVTKSASRKTEVREQVEIKENGDVLIKNIPMFNQGGRGYCAMGTLAMVMQYYGMNINIDQLAARANYKDGDTENSKVLPIYQMAAKEAKLRYTEKDTVRFKEVQRLIDKGRPLLVWRWFSRERDEVHRQFKKLHAQDPKAELPNPKTVRSEKGGWPTRATGGHASLVTGYNKERGEIIFSESWGEENRDRRMREEELEATAYAVFVFEP